MRAVLAALMLCVSSLFVQAKPAAQAQLHLINRDGDRFADFGSEVADSVRCAIPTNCKRKSERTRQRKKWRKKIRVHEGAFRAHRAASVTLSRSTPVPFPVARPAGAPGPDEEAANAVDEAIVWNHPLAVVLPAPYAGVRGNLFHGFAREIARAVRGVSLAGVVAPLAAKARELADRCGSRVISARIGRTRSVVRGSGRPSLHRKGLAVDMSGNPKCMYALLRNWPGGVSIDYALITPPHIHISYGGREHGKRFSHYRGGRKQYRYARHLRRYASR